MSGSPSRPARVLSGALLGLVLAAPSGLLAVPSASAAPRVEVEPLAEACGVRLSFAGLPSRAFTVHLDLVALDPVRPLALTPPGPRQVDGGGPSAMDVPAEGLSGATASRAYWATVALDGEEQPPVELLLPECADPAVASANPAATVSPTPASGSPSPNASRTSSPAASGTAAPSPSGTAGPTASGTASPTPSGTPAAAPASASATPTATTSPEPSGAPVFGPRAVSAPSTAGSGVIALSGAMAAAPLGGLPAAPAPAAAPAPVVAAPTGVAAAVAPVPPLAAVLPSLPGQAAVLPAPAPQAAAPEAAAVPPAAVAAEPAAADATWTTGLPAALLITGAAAGALGLRLRRLS